MVLASALPLSSRANNCFLASVSPVASARWRARIGSCRRSSATDANSPDNVDSCSPVSEPAIESNRSTSAAWASRLADRIPEFPMSGVKAAGAIDSNSSRNLSTVADRACGSATWARTRSPARRTDSLPRSVRSCRIIWVRKSDTCWPPWTLIRSTSTSAWVRNCSAIRTESVRASSTMCLASERPSSTRLAWYWSAAASRCVATELSSS